VQNALETLQFVEIRTIKANGTTRRVTFGINNLDAYSLDAVSKALPSKYRKGLREVEPPKPVAP